MALSRFRAGLVLHRAAACEEPGAGIPQFRIADKRGHVIGLSSLETAIHGAAPCPVLVKEQIIAWWGPIVFEYYAATEAHCVVFCDSAEWLAHRGTVGRVLLGELHVLDEDMQPVATGTSGTLWFKTASEFEYFKDPAKTAEARSPDGTMSTVLLGRLSSESEDG